MILNRLISPILLLMHGRSSLIPCLLSMQKMQRLCCLEKTLVVSLRTMILLRTTRITSQILEVFCMMLSSTTIWIVMMYPLVISSSTTSKLITSILKKVVRLSSLPCIPKMINFLTTFLPIRLLVKKTYKTVRSSFLQNKQIRVVGSKSLPLKFVFEQIL